MRIFLAIEIAEKMAPKITVNTSRVNGPFKSKTTFSTIQQTSLFKLSIIFLVTLIKSTAANNKYY